MSGGVTFAVVGRDEEATLGAALEDALAAARAGDEVVFVDSGSADGSGEVASSLGVRVVGAPVGKGRAVAAVVRGCATEWIVLLDADREWSERSPAALLRSAVDAAGPEVSMVVAALVFVDREQNLTRYLYRPLVSALVREAAGVGDPCPLSGFRAVRLAAARRALPFPPGFGLETWLNLSVASGGAAAGARVVSVDLGRYREALGATVVTVGSDVAAAILDFAAGAGRLGRAGVRAEWEAWAARVIEACAAGAGDGVVAPEAVSAVLAEAEAPLPPVGAHGR